MITYEAIIKKAERKYKDVLRAWLTGDETLFPLEFRVGRLSKDLEERRRQIEQLRQRSKEQAERGYAIVWQTVNKRNLSTQTTPRRIIIETLDDYLALLRRVTEFDNFTRDADKIRQQFPTLGAWLQAHPQTVIDYHGAWDDLLTVCDYFVKHPRPNVYSRELPIAVHTKFIEKHVGILSELLDEILPDDAITADESNFNMRYGLKTKPILVRMRVLEEQLDWQFGLRLEDLTLPVEQLAHLLRDHLKPKRVIIVENQINFLTVPQLPAAVALFGGGFGVQVLCNVDWLVRCEIIYWGDIDAHGFQILSDLRKNFPHTRAIMMDSETLERYADYIVPSKQTRRADFAGLTPDELDILSHVQENNLRLEQEHIPQQYVVLQLKRALR